MTQPTDRKSLAEEIRELHVAVYASELIGLTEFACYCRGHDDACKRNSKLAAEREREWAERVERLEACIRHLEPLIDCDQLHHCPSDRHGIGEPCPAEARLTERVKAALSNLQQARTWQ